MFFPGLVFLAIRQAARLQALPYPLHDFAGAFLAAAPSFDRDSPHAGLLITAKVKKPSPTVPVALDHQFVLLVNLSKVSSPLCKLKPGLTFDKFIWRAGCS